MSDIIKDSAKHPTMTLSRTADGRLRAVDNSVWKFFKVPTGPVADARSFHDKLRVFAPLMDAFDELALMPSISVKRRAVSKSDYRIVQLKGISLPRLWRPGPDHRLSEFLRANFPNLETLERSILLGVRLKESAGGGGGLSKAIESITHTLVEGGTLMSDYDKDAQRVSAAMARAGLVPATAHEVQIANSWWNRGVSPETVNLPCAEHLHVFSDHRSVMTAQRKGLEDCHSWPVDLAGHDIISFGSLADLDIGFTPADAPNANWIIPLMTDTLAVSVRGKIEPAVVTREELKRRRKQINDDIKERARQMGERGEAKAEQVEAQQVLADVEAVYATGSGTPTITEASVLFAFDGEVHDFSALSHYGPATIRPMSFRQSSALAEMMICSPVRANPNLHDFPTQTVVASGLQSLSKVGDKDGIFRGLTEKDLQPVWYSPEAAYTEDSAPVSVTVGASGSGKTMMLQWDAYQTAKAGYPQVIFDPKSGSDLSPSLATLPADQRMVYSLDRLLTSDGIFDPVKFSPSEETAVELASSMISTVNPWGTQEEMARREADIINGLRYGISKGARATGQALKIAAEDEIIPQEIYRTMSKVSLASPMFSALFGHDPDTQGLRLFDGTTLIKVGDANLSLPEPGAQSTTLIQRVNLALVKMVVFGSAMALNKRKGVIRLDEAWVFLSSSKEDIDRLARVARSQNIQLELYTQKVSDALNAGIKGFITRGTLLHVMDEVEARASCELLNLEPTPELLHRIRSLGIRDKESQTPNWESLRHLKDPQTGQIIRGTVSYQMDTSGTTVPVTSHIPEWFIKAASTNPRDVQERMEREQAEIEARLAQENPENESAPVLP